MCLEPLFFVWTPLFVKAFFKGPMNRFIEGCPELHAIVASSYPIVDLISTLPSENSPTTVFSKIGGIM
jgi:hypothetical protein